MNYECETAKIHYEQQEQNNSKVAENNTQCLNDRIEGHL